MMGNISYRRKGQIHADPGAYLPGGHKRLAYIQSTGTQHIDTGVVAGSGFRAVADITLTGALSSTLTSIIGAHNPAPPYGRNFLAAKSGAYEVGIGDGWMDGGTPSIGVRQTLEASTIHGDAYLLIDGARQNMTTSDKPSATHSTNTLHLLNINGGEAWVGKAPCKLYEAKIYDSKSALARDFVPCISPSGAVGLYDLVGKKFYGNAGTGAFIGSEVP